MPAGISAPEAGDHDGRVVAQHVEPDAMSFRELAAAKACAFHLFQESGHRTIAVHLDRTRGSGQVFRCFRFSLRDHKVVNLSNVNVRVMIAG